MFKTYQFSLSPAAMEWTARGTLLISTLPSYESRKVYTLIEFDPATATLLSGKLYSNNRRFMEAAHLAQNSLEYAAGVARDPAYSKDNIFVAVHQPGSEFCADFLEQDILDSQTLQNLFFIFPSLDVGDKGPSYTAEITDPPQLHSIAPVAESVATLSQSRQNQAVCSQAE